MICSVCHSEFENTDLGSFPYQDEYEHKLPAICERCLGDICNRVEKRKG